MKTKIRWGNLVRAFLFIGSLLVIIHDLYMVTISQFVTGYMVGFTCLGLITFIVAIMILIDNGNKLKKELVRASSTK